MALNVSRVTTVIRKDGKPPCSRCGRPVQRTRRRGGQGRPQSLCNGCHAEDMRGRRAGKVEALLSPEEWAGVVQGRRLRTAADAAAGRHRRAG